MTGKWLKYHVFNLEDDAEFAFDLWQVEDVEGRAKELGVELTKEESAKVINNMHLKRDASIGLNWAVMDVHIDSVVEKDK